MGRPRADNTAQPRELFRLREWLQDWRKSHERGVAFPDKFWVSAGRAARRNGVHATARALGLEYNKLKRASGVASAAGVGSKMPAMRRSAKFIELTGALSRNLSECRLTLQGADGQRLSVEMASGAAVEVVLQLCRSGWGAA
jgi:hypothetical protein